MLNNEKDADPFGDLDSASVPSMQKARSQGSKSMKMSNT